MAVKSTVLHFFGFGDPQAPPELAPNLNSHPVNITITFAKSFPEDVNISRIVCLSLLQLLAEIDCLHTAIPVRCRAPKGIQCFDFK
jgi:hypothetical protein